MGVGVTAVQPHTDGGAITDSCFRYVHTYSVFKAIVWDAASRVGTIGCSCPGADSKGAGED